MRLCKAPPGISSVRVLVPIMLALLCTSCARERAGKHCYPVKGRVLIRGKAATGALVVFYPVDKADGKSPSASGTCDEEGWFNLSTYEQGDGAPAGDYQVAITSGKGFGRQVLKKSAKPQRIGDGYKDPKTSRIRAHVEEKENELVPFELR
ncbi:MAG TPA: hypothetical protein VG013_23685 [Gemmataceae bacterium]|jgi:hypothetical protein|nr:hypothetical protein [Gemmataceae bacterium]